MKKNSLFIFSFFLITTNVCAQENAVIKLVNPLKADNNVSASKQFIIGSTCKTCQVAINGQAVKVYPTGAFALQLNLKQPVSSHL